MKRFSEEQIDDALRKFFQATRIEKVWLKLLAWFFKGLGAVLPLALTVWVALSIFNWIKVKVALSAVASMWFGGLFILIAIGALIGIGFLFSYIKILPRIISFLEKIIFKRIPVLNKVYNFSDEIIKSFEKSESDKPVVVIEVEMTFGWVLGILTDAENHMGMVFSAPSPLTGVTSRLKPDKYNILGIKYVDATQINISGGRIGGKIWATASELAAANKKLQTTDEV